MVLHRTLTAVILAAAFTAASSAALAGPPPWAHGGRHGNRNEQNFSAQAQAPRAHGIVEGTIAGIDYGAAAILVATPRGIVPVSVTPTTSIFHGAAFGSLSDLSRGQRVSIDVSQTGGRLVAQIIRIH